MNAKNLILSFLFVTCAFSQEYEYSTSIGNFRNALSFYINPSGEVFVSDDGTNEIFKLDTLGNFIDKIGGYGWTAALFDYPADVFANSLSVYISDYNNHRIQRFDKDLNFISELSTRDSENEDERFGYPLSCAASNQGDLYILDSENRRIIKFDLFGNFIQNFGGYDAGFYTLSNPTKLAITPGGHLYILDKDKMVIFDQYGNGIGVIHTGKTYNSIRIIFNMLIINTDDEIRFTDLRAMEPVLNPVALSGYEEEDKFVSSLIFNGKLYVLTEKTILVFNKKSIDKK